MKKIYLDYGASTPVDPLVMAAMEPYFSKEYGNSGSVHSFGQAASAAIFKARKTIADALGVNYDEIIFTGSATEANNLALRGVTKRCRIQNPRIIVSAFEHVSILETCRDLEKDGVEVIYIPVNRDGFVDLKKIKAALNERTVLVSVMYVNNEVGTIQPISKISELIRDFRRRRSHLSSLIPHLSYPLFHTDAVQAFQYLDCDVDRLGVDLMTLSAHKIYGPKGIGALCIRNQKSKIKNQNFGSDFIAPIVTGGGQEPGGLWSGTPNTPLIVGFGKAAEISEKMRVRESRRILKLRDYCWRELKKAVPKSALNGNEKNRVPNNLNVYFPGQGAYDLVMKLDLRGVAVSAGVACSARMIRPSPALLAMGFPASRSAGSLRITLGRPTLKIDIDEFNKTVKNVLR